MTILLEEREWEDYANCQGVDSELFFPERGASTQPAREYCRGCVVRGECLEANLFERHGVFGGLSARERGRLRKERGVFHPPRACVVCERVFNPVNGKTYACSPECQSRRTSRIQRGLPVADKDMAAVERMRAARNGMFAEEVPVDYDDFQTFNNA